MKTFLLSFFVLLALTLIAWQWQPKLKSGKRPLVWVTDDNPARRAQVDLFNRLNPDIDLSIDPSDIGVEKVIVQCKGGVGPDIFDCGSGNDLATYVQSGIAWDITDWVVKNGIDPRKIAWPCIHPMSVRDGKVYGFGCNAAADAIFYNKSIFREEGVPFPKREMTWDEFRALAKRMTKLDAQGHVARYGLLADWYNWPNFTYGFGGREYSPDGKRCTLDSPENIHGIELMQDLIYRDKVMPSPVDEAAMATQGGWGSGNITLFGGGKSAMSIGGRWWLTNLRKYPGLELGVVPMPKSITNDTRGYGRATLINVRSPHREDALRFVTYQTSRAYNELVNRQADGIGPAMAYESGPAFLHNPDYPGETDNAVWLYATAHAVADQASPYISGDVALRLITKQLDMVQANEKSPADAFHSATTQIDEQMQKELNDDPELKARYEAAR